MTDKHLADIVEVASELLANRDRHRAEGNVQSDVEALLRAMNVGTIESHYQLGNDQADIYLPNRRAFIECKAFPGAEDPERSQRRSNPESPRQQLDRYVRAEIENEINLLPGLFADNAAPWTGIVTDGSNWHVYTYQNKVGAISKLDSSQFFLNEASSLAEFLIDTLGTQMVGKEWIPKNPGVLFSDLKSELDDLYRELPSKAGTPTLTKRRLWLDMMKTSGMIPADEAGQERLFLAHSFLIVIARLVSHTLAAFSDESHETVLKDGFASWILDFDRGSVWAKRMWEQIDGFDWRRRRGDVLRELYHTYVSEYDRKVFGEFYTPDWLASLMVEAVLDEEWISRSVSAALSENVDNIGVLDPACGSGTFLYHAAQRLLSSRAVKELRPGKKANVVARLINGMDIHPVAVEITRVNIERALPCGPTEGASAFRVFLGDSLQTSARGDLLFGHTENAMRITTPEGRHVMIPMSFVDTPSFAENMRRMVNSAASGQPLPDDLVIEKNGDELIECHRQLETVIENEGNSVWTWYAINLAGPNLLAKRKVDRIVANPPWVRLSSIQVVDRKRTMEKMGEELGLQAGGKLAPHLDIASFFVLRCRDLYLANPNQNPAVWLVKKSAIQSSQWEAFRDLHRKTLSQSVDLQNVAPFGGGDARRCCLLMEHLHLPSITEPRLAARRLSRAFPLADDTLEIARSKIEFVKAPPLFPRAPSDYNDNGFYQGATIVPHVLAIIESKYKSSDLGQVVVKTKSSQHSPWNSIPSQQGQIPATWVRPLHTSPDMLPYMASRSPPLAIIPVDARGTMNFKPGIVCSFWRELDEIYDTYRGRGKSTPATLFEQFNFASKLSRQTFTVQSEALMVLYPSSGDIMRAARTREGAAVVDSTLFWRLVGSEDEAGYLVAILNANCMRRAFAESRSSGRDFQLHPWRNIPIPRYDGNNREHYRLAELCAEAEKITARRVKEVLDNRPQLRQQGLSKAIRETVQNSKVGKEIECIVSSILPEQVD